MNDTPMGERVHIAFFGRRNAGKSSTVNAVTSQRLSVVSDTPGTTTDPVYKSMELLPVGPVVIIDTAGFDDEGELGKLRVEKTYEVLSRTDFAVLVVDATTEMGEYEKKLIDLFKKNNIAYIVAKNKCDLLEDFDPEKGIEPSGKNEIYISAVTGHGITELKERIAVSAKESETERALVSDLLETGDSVLLIIPIDKAAPKGRLILPQQQVIRDVLEAGAVASAVRDTELADALTQMSPKPKMVITDSQVFGKVKDIVPESIPLTSFSILMARYKGFLDEAVKGAEMISKLKDGDKILISEGCTHHRQCGDIGSEKLPKLLKKFTGKDLEIRLTSGREYLEDLSEYAISIHCGGCMLTERDMQSRMRVAVSQGVPFTNYGIAIAYMNGILKRSLQPLNVDGRYDSIVK